MLNYDQRSGGPAPLSYPSELTGCGPGAGYSLVCFRGNWDQVQELQNSRQAKKHLSYRLLSRGFNIMYLIYKSIYFS